MKYRTPFVLLLLSLVATNDALRVLVCFPMIAKSHSILGHGIVDRLLEAGHEVVHITSYPREKVVPKLKEINSSSISQSIVNDTKQSESYKLKNMIGSSAGDTLLLPIYTYMMHKKLIEEPNVVKLLSDPNEKFDVVILDWFISEITVGIPPLFEAPLIWVCSTDPHWQSLRLIDEIPNPAYSIDIFASYRPPLSFGQRVDQLWNTIKKYLFLNLVIIPLEKWTYNSVYPEIAAKRGVTMPSYNDALYNGSLMFINSHPALGGAMKLPQNAINVAGYHIKDQVQPLPKDLQKIMDEAKHGEIYFSMGSSLLSDGMSEGMKRSLLNLFSKLDQTVIWKYESDLNDVPKNVHLVKWAPQPSILSHPNLRLFITHGGQLSTVEAIHYGVPLVGLPVHGDQHINMGTVESKGFGIKVKIAEDMAEELDAAIRKVLTDKSYKDRAIELSSIYHDRPMKVGADIAYWVQYVVKTRGARHLRSPSLTVYFYQRFYLDLLLVLSIIGVITRKIVQYVLNMRSKKSKKNKNE